MLTARIATIRGGYTMDDLDRLAKAAARRRGGQYAGDYADRYEAAWSRIAERLYETDGVPTERELLFAGMDAVQDTLAERNHNQGRSHRRGYEFGTAPRFAAYWNERLVVGSHETRIVENIALRQALAVLTPEQYEALAAAAVCPTLRMAAMALGLGYDRFLGRFYRARDAVRAVWFEHEQAPSKVGVKARASESTCGSGHDKAKHQKVSPSTGHRYCGECQRLARKRRRARARGAAA